MSSVTGWLTTLGIFLMGIRRMLFAVGDALLVTAMQLKAAKKILQFIVVVFSKRCVHVLESCMYCTHYITLETRLFC